MADQDKSLKDIIKFVDPTGTIDDGSVGELATQLKFSEVLDIVSALKDNNVDAARNILAAHSDVFKGSAPAQSQSAADEATESTIPQVKSTTNTMGKSSFAKIAPKGSIGSRSPTLGGSNAQGSDEEDLDQVINDPQKQNDPAVKQIKSLLGRITR
jgi:hypothetical protein